MGLPGAGQGTAQGSCCTNSCMQKNPAKSLAKPCVCTGSTARSTCLLHGISEQGMRFLSTQNPQLCHGAHPAIRLSGSCPVSIPGVGGEEVKVLPAPCPLIHIHTHALSFQANTNYVFLRRESTDISPKDITSLDEEVKKITSLS